MVRTAADPQVRVSGGKSSKKAATAGSSRGSTSSSSTERVSHGGGNPICPRETPSWQKPITNFFYKAPKEFPTKSDGDDDTPKACSSKCMTEDKENVSCNVDEPSSVHDSDSEGIPLEPEVVLTENGSNRNGSKSESENKEDEQVDNPSKKVKYEELCKNIEKLEKGKMFI